MFGSFFGSVQVGSVRLCSVVFGWTGVAPSNRSRFPGFRFGFRILTSCDSPQTNRRCKISREGPALPGSDRTGVFRRMKLCQLNRDARAVKVPIPISIQYRSRYSTDTIPIYTDMMPIYTDTIPIFTDTMPIYRYDTDIYRYDTDTDTILIRYHPVYRYRYETIPM